MNINSLLPHDAQNNQNAVSLQLEKKWERTGLLEGMNNEVERKSMAVLLENQAKQLVTEANSSGTETNSEEWAGVALPLVRRIFAEIAAKDFVSVQPMNLPSGLVFYLDFKYGTAQGAVGFGNADAGTAFGNDFLTGQGRTSQLDSVFGVTDKVRGNGTDTAVEGLYGAGRFGYSINDVNSAAVANVDALNSTAECTVGAGYSSGSYNQVTNLWTSLRGDAVAMTQAQFDLATNFDAEFSASGVDNDDTFLQIAVATASLAGADVEGVRAFNVSGSCIKAVFPKFTTTTTNDSHVIFLTSVATIGDIDSPLEVAYQKAPTSITRGDFEDTESLGSDTAALDIPEINLELRSEAIVAKTRKLKAVWSPEFAQDLNAYHSIDAEAELTSMLSEYVSQEIDLEILDMLIQNAQTVERWSAKIGFQFDSSTNSFTQTNATAQAYNQGTWFQTLGTKIQKVSNKIHQLTLRGGANFLVCSPSVATILESIPGYAADTDGDKMQFAMGVQKVGAINNRFQVYKNPYMTESTILMGYRGAQFLETGAVYAPYIPLIMTPLVYDPNNFTPRKGVMTRYAKKMVRPEFYGKIFVGHLNTV